MCETMHKKIPNANNSSKKEEFILGNCKKRDQVDNLMNLVERHTRTERHLEQYSEIGRKEDKERAREKQNIREQEMNTLKSKIVNPNETKIEQAKNLADNYQRTQSYMEDNYEKLSKERLDNMQEKQDNRREQMENLSENIYKENH